MEFATLDKMLEKLEEEKKAYVKRMDEQLKEIKACVEKMRSDYRNETMPKATGMVEYMLERAKKRLGEDFVQACDISEDELDDFYEMSNRKIDISKIVFRWSNRTGVYYLYFSETTLYLYPTVTKEIQEFKYKSIKSIEQRYSGSIPMRDYDIYVSEKDRTYYAENLKNAIGENKGLARLILDLKEYVDRN